MPGAPDWGHRPGKLRAMSNVLLVDDESGIRVTLSHFLRGAGHSVTSCDNPVDGLRLALELMPDIVVTDVVMPQGSGLDLLRDVRRALPDTQVIVITGAPTLETAQEAVQYGAYDFLLKPVDKEAIVRAVGAASSLADVLRRKRALAEENERHRAHLEEQVAARARSLEDQMRRLRAVMDVAAAIYAGQNLRTALRIVREAVTTVCGFDRAAVFLYEPATCVLEAYWGTDRSGRLEDISGGTTNLSVNPEYPLAALMRGELPYAYTEDFERDHRVPAGATMSDVHHHLAVPLRAGERIVGAITVDNLLSDRPITPADMEALLPFAAVAGAAIDSAAATERLAAELAERTETEARLAARSRELEALHQVTAELAVTNDPERIFALLHGAITQMLPGFMFLVSRFTPEDDLIRCLYGWSTEGRMDVSDLPPIALQPEGMGAQSRVLRSGKTMIFDDFQAATATSTVNLVVEEDGTVYEDESEVESTATRAVISPMKLHGKVVGAIQVLAEEHEMFSQDHARILDALAAQAAVALAG
ncbi:MAG: response regulator [Armatimonadetes bacterium]|nr:response regulator [Armatimonadota bacterium]